MAYTALEKVRQINLNKYGKDVGPFEPYLFVDEKSKNNLKSAALSFIHNRCEGLNFDYEKESLEEKNNEYYGSSLKEKQIPFNMQMDINRLCFERELETFIDSGVAEDAYNVYYCYLEMFFGHYGKSKKMVELLSEFESNGSSLLMKHRDHYSHSVYVFALGLAIYETNEAYRNSFNEYYDLKDEKKAANTFLKYWGLTSLFHDIGYPFELPFEQVISYYEVDNKQRGEGSLYIAYHDIDLLTQLNDDEKKHLKDLYQKEINTTEELFAYDLYLKLGKIYDFKYEDIIEIIHNKPIKPNEFGYFMDHAYFSSLRLYHELVESLGNENINKKHVDALSAILLHNSLFKFAIAFYKSKNAKAPLKMKNHPLAYLLMLCDELQCWDRTAYGRNSRKELHPMAADFDFSDNKIKATYYYDEDELEKINNYEVSYKKWIDEGKQGKPPRLKAYSDMANDEQSFRTDIEKIVDTSNIKLTVITDLTKIDYRHKHTYLSNSNFLHLYDFAVALNARYNYQGKESSVSVEELENEFEKLSLEYQISNINQAKSFSKYLNALACFYSDKPVDYEMINSFTKQQIDKIAPLEHERWVIAHAKMAWTYGDDYEKFSSDNSGMLRELFRQHKLAMDNNPSEKEIFKHYEDLPLKEKEKDYEPFNSMLKLIKKFDGLRIYKLDYDE